MSIALHATALHADVDPIIPACCSVSILRINLNPVPFLEQQR